MVTTTRKTLAEFLALPGTEPASECVCGEVIQGSGCGDAQRVSRAGIRYFIFSGYPHREKATNVGVVLLPLLRRNNILTLAAGGGQRDAKASGIRHRSSGRRRVG